VPGFDGAQFHFPVTGQRKALRTCLGELSSLRAGCANTQGKKLGARLRVRGGPTGAEGGDVQLSCYKGGGEACKTRGSIERDDTGFCQQRTGIPSDMVGYCLDSRWEGVRVVRGWGAQLSYGGKGAGRSWEKRDNVADQNNCEAVDRAGAWAAKEAIKAGGAGEGRAACGGGRWSWCREEARVWWNN